MKFQNILEQVNFRPWVITPRAHMTIVDLLNAKMGQSFMEKQAARPKVDLFGNPLPQMSIVEGVAIIPIHGIMGKGFGDFEKSCGAVDTMDISEEIRAAVADPRVRQIFLDIDSPGGTVAGTPELVDVIKAAREKKPIMAWTENQACSAGYWIFAVCDLNYCSKSADVGSIGVYLPWLDQTAAYAMRGLRVELIKNQEGTFKGAGYPGTALTDDQRAQLQESVDQTFEMFSQDILASRPGVPLDSMRGQCFMGAYAFKAGLVDAVTTREQAFADTKRMSR